MAAGRIIVPGWMPALDQDGEPIPNARMYFYQNQTTSLAVVYTDATLTTPLPNPVAANSSGQFPAIWADDANLFSVTIDAPFGPPGQPFTYDDLGPSTSANTDTTNKLDRDAANAEEGVAENLPYRASAPARLRSAQEVLQDGRSLLEFTPGDLPASAIRDGSNTRDLSASVASAIEAVTLEFPDRGVRLNAPAGEYLIGAPVEAPLPPAYLTLMNSLVIRGDGRRATKFRMAPDNNQGLFKILKDTHNVVDLSGFTVTQTLRGPTATNTNGVPLWITTDGFDVGNETTWNVGSDGIYSGPVMDMGGTNPTTLRGRYHDPKLLVQSPLGLSGSGAVQVRVRTSDSPAMTGAVSTLMPLLYGQGAFQDAANKYGSGLFGGLVCNFLSSGQTPMPLKRYVQVDVITTGTVAGPVFAVVSVGSSTYNPLPGLDLDRTVFLHDLCFQGDALSEGEATLQGGIWGPSTIRIDHQWQPHLKNIVVTGTVVGPDPTIWPILMDPNTNGCAVDMRNCYLPTLERVIVPGFFKKGISHSGTLRWPGAQSGRIEGGLFIGCEVANAIDGYVLDHPFQAEPFIFPNEFRFIGCVANARHRSFHLRNTQSTVITTGMSILAETGTDPYQFSDTPAWVHVDDSHNVEINGIELTGYGGYVNDGKAFCGVSITGKSTGVTVRGMKWAQMQGIGVRVNNTGTPLNPNVSRQSHYIEDCVRDPFALEVGTFRPVVDVTGTATVRSTRRFPTFSLNEHEDSADSSDFAVHRWTRHNKPGRAGPQLWRHEFVGHNAANGQVIAAATQVQLIDTVAGAEKGRHQIVVKDGPTDLSMVDTRPDGVRIGTYLAGPVLLANGAVAPPRLTLAQANALAGKIDGMQVQISNTARGERPCWWSGSGNTYRYVSDDQPVT